MTHPSNTPDAIPNDRESDATPTAYSRRAFLGRTATLGAIVGLPSLLTACGGGDENEAPGAETTDEAPDASVAAGDVQASECEGYDALTEQDLQTRQTLGYVDNSPDPAKLCNNCQFYNQPEGGSPCGGCQLFQGPVAPEGYCNSWVAMAGQAPADTATT